MSNVNPSSSVHSSVPPKAGPTSLAAIANPPPAIAKLASGTVIIGTVLRQEAQGHTFLRTEHGQLTLTTRLPLPTGTEVKLEVQAVGARLQAIILSVNGRQVASGATIPVPTPAPPPAAGGPSVTPQAGPAASTPASGSAPTTQGQAASQPVPPSGAGITPAAGTPTLQSAAISATLVPGASNPGVTSTPLASGQAIPLQIAVLSLQMPGGTPPATTPAIPMATSATGGTVLTGNVLGANGQGQPVLQTPLGQLTLPIRAELPTGAVLTFELLEPPIQRAGGAESFSRTALQMTAEWASLKEALQTFGQTDPALQATMMNVAIPKTGTDMVAKLFHYLSALVKGDIRNWLGERALRSLDRAGKEVLVQRLSDEFTQMSRLALRGGEEWRTILFPILHESDLHQARLFLRHHGSEQDGTDDEATGTRIIVEVSLTRLGELQLDGLYHARRFDLILRTHTPLPVYMTTQIRSIFEGCCESSALRGDIMFRANEPFASTPLRKPHSSDLGLEV